MSYETRAYDKPNDDGFPPDPVVVLVATGTHDVSRLVHLLNGGSVLIEQLLVGKRLLEQVGRHNTGQAALKLLRQHGGPDFTDEPPNAVSNYPGYVVARWGHRVFLAGEDVDPVPAVHANSRPGGEIDVGDMRLSLDVAEALAARVLVAVRYQRRIERTATADRGPE